MSTKAAPAARQTAHSTALSLLYLELEEACATAEARVAELEAENARLNSTLNEALMQERKNSAALLDRVVAHIASVQSSVADSKETLRRTEGTVQRLHDDQAAIAARAKTDTAADLRIETELKTLRALVEAHQQQPVAPGIDTGSLIDAVRREMVVPRPSPPGRYEVTIVERDGNGDGRRFIVKAAKGTS